jgi:DNA adenine methylase
MLKSPLRYPGGKSKAIKVIQKYLPTSFSEYREPFVGGGSLFIYLKQINPNIKFWINDLNSELIFFWKFVQADLENLVSEVRHIKETCKDGKSLFHQLTTVDVTTLSELERAVRFFVLNRITFSGTVESGGFSEAAFYRRYTDSSIDRLEKLGSIVKDIKITNLDYSQVLDDPGQNVFIFLDPPYLSATKSKLYGKKGDLHSTFNHQEFSNLMQSCKHKWLVTYDNSPQIKANFDFANIFEWELQYGMNNYKQSHAAKGNELIITNYQLSRETSNNLSKEIALQMSLFEELSIS